MSFRSVLVLVSDLLCHAEDSLAQVVGCVLRLSAGTVCCPVLAVDRLSIGTSMPPSFRSLAELPSQLNDCICA